MSAPVKLGLHRQHLLQVRVVGEGDELLEGVTRDHAGLLSEDREELGLAAVVAQELVQLFGHDGSLEQKVISLRLKKAQINVNIFPLKL